MNATLPPITRPDGRTYRPRKVIACAIIDEDEILSGVIVFGTHDPERAAPLAQDFVTWQLGAGYAPLYSGGGWWRDGFEGGRRVWLSDDERGRAGVMFARIVEAPQLEGATP